MFWNKDKKQESVFPWDSNYKPQPSLFDKRRGQDNERDNYVERDALDNWFDNYGDVNDEQDRNW